MRIAIVGAGFSGIGMAIALRRAGHTDVTVFERSGDIGGVWNHNTYPGRRLRRAVLPVLLHRRPAPRLDAPVLAAARDPRLPARRRRAPRRASSVRLNTRGRERRLRRGRAARWTLTPRAASASRPTHSCSPAGSSAARGCPTSPGWASSRARASTRPSGTTPSTSRAGGSRSWGPARARCSSCPRSPSGPRASTSTSARRRGSCRGATASTRRGRRRRSGASRACRSCAARDARVHGAGIASQTRVRPLALSLRAWSSWHMFRQVKDPELRRRLRPRLPDRLQARAVHLALPARAAATERGARRPTDRAHQRARRRGTRGGHERAVDAIVYGTGFDAHAFVAPMAVTGAGGRTLASAWAGARRRTSA